jgi:hypothetical protein
MYKVASEVLPGPFQVMVNGQKGKAIKGLDKLSLIVSRVPRTW